MQYLEGRSLKELIDARPHPRAGGRRWSARCSRAPASPTATAIVHRDLKPQNVIVDDEGKAVVTDFGIARAGVSEITQTGSVMGTPHYLSPEQAQGFEVTAGLRPLLDRRDPLRGADRPRPLRGRKRRRGRDEAGLPDAAAAELDQPRRSPRRSTRW